MNLFSLQRKSRAQFRLIYVILFLDILNFVSSDETLKYISLLLNLITKQYSISIIQYNLRIPESDKTGILSPPDATLGPEFFLLISIVTPLGTSLLLL